MLQVAVGRAGEFCVKFASCTLDKFHAFALRRAPKFDKTLGRFSLDGGRDQMRLDSAVDGIRLAVGAVVYNLSRDFPSHRIIPPIFYKFGGYWRKRSEPTRGSTPSSPDANLARVQAHKTHTSLQLRNHPATQPNS